jgi:hypothetical protein
LSPQRWYINAPAHVGDLIRSLCEVIPLADEFVEFVTHINVNENLIKDLSSILNCEIVFLESQGDCADLYRIAKNILGKYTKKTYILSEEKQIFDEIATRHYIYNHFWKIDYLLLDVILTERLTKLGLRTSDLPPTEFKPNFPVIDANYYIEKYGIVPGKTYWISPEARSERPMEPKYWNILANTLRLQGYYVCFNITELQNAHLYDGVIVAPPLQMCVPFANLCGYVISQRSGLCDWLRFSDAKITILYNSKEYGGEIASGFADYIFRSNPNIRHLYFPETELAKYYSEYDVSRTFTERGERNSEIWFGDSEYKSVKKPKFMVYHKHGFAKSL